MVYESRSEPILVNIAARLQASFRTLQFPNLVPMPNEPTKRNPNNSNIFFFPSAAGGSIKTPRLNATPPH
jgi:hypothetical protein